MRNVLAASPMTALGLVIAVVAVAVGLQGRDVDASTPLSPPEQRLEEMRSEGITGERLELAQQAVEDYQKGLNFTGPTLPFGPSPQPPGGFTKGSYGLRDSCEQYPFLPKGFRIENCWSGEDAFRGQDLNALIGSEPDSGAVSVYLWSDEPLDYHERVPLDVPESDSPRISGFTDGKLIVSTAEGTIEVDPSSGSVADLL